MSFGTGSERNPTSNAYSFKIKSKENGKYLPRPIFEVKKKVGDKYELQVDSNGKPVSATRVSGTLIAMEHKEFTWKSPTGNQLIQSVNIVLTDKKEDAIYFITIPYSYMGISAVNSLLALKTFDDIKLELYQTKPKTDGGKSYGALAVNQGGKKVDWKFKKEELPPVDKVKFQGKDLSDFSNLIKFVSAEIEKFSKNLKDQGATIHTVDQSPVNNTVDNASDEKDEDVPF